MSTLGFPKQEWSRGLRLPWLCHSKVPDVLSPLKGFFKRDLLRLKFRRKRSPKKFRLRRRRRRRADAIPERDNIGNNFKRGNLLLDGQDLREWPDRRLSWCVPHPTQVNAIFFETQQAIGNLSFQRSQCRKLPRPFVFPNWLGEKKIWAWRQRPSLALKVWSYRKKLSRRFVWEVSEQKAKFWQQLLVSENMSICSSWLL